MGKKAVPGQLEVWNPSWVPGHTDPMDQVHFYIIRCRDDFPYGGTTKEPLKRIKDHWIGKGAEKCHMHGPEEVMFVSPGTAVRWEAERVEKVLKRRLERWWEDHEHTYPKGVVEALVARVATCPVTADWLCWWEVADVTDVEQRCREATDYYTPECAGGRRGDAIVWEWESTGHGSGFFRSRRAFG